MKVISPGSVQGTIEAPPSKSMMQRAVAAATLARGETIIEYPSYSDDGLAALQISEALGAQVQRAASQVKITGGGPLAQSRLECGEAGFSMRLFSAISALFDTPLTLHAEGSLRGRPMRLIEEPLRALGATVTTNDGCAPLTICGPIRGGRVAVDGSVSSQFISGLLMALPLCEGSSTVTVENVTSVPYLRMTLSVLKDFGIQVEASEGFDFFSIPGGQQYRPCRYTVEGDWSGASFPLVLGAIVGSVTVRNLRPESFQADRAIETVLRSAGASLVRSSDSFTSSRGILRAFECDATNCPDLFPPLVVLALCAEGRSAIHGVSRLTFKESNRGEVLMREFLKLGGKLEIEGNSMYITGGELSGGTVSSHNDHRIAMALAIAAKRANGAVSILNPECVGKSYPLFFEMLASVEEKK